MSTAENHTNAMSPYRVPSDERPRCPTCGKPLKEGAVTVYCLECRAKEILWSTSSKPREEGFRAPSMTIPVWISLYVAFSWQQARVSDDSMGWTLVLGIAAGFVAGIAIRVRWRNRKVPFWMPIFAGLVCGGLVHLAVALIAPR
jgi:hypothetical protein